MEDALPPMRGLDEPRRCNDKARRDGSAPHYPYGAITIGSPCASDNLHHALMRCEGLAIPSEHPLRLREKVAEFEQSPFVSG